ncbi:MAG: PDZ domain-containing protein, partial [Planctomycetales bacterium]|nr:PDZ domain-containing protein [Planctomycetales bacterium]
QGRCTGWLTHWRPLDGQASEVPATEAEPGSPSERIGWAMPLDASLVRIWRELANGDAPRFGFLGIRPRATRESVRRRGFQGVSVYDVAPATPAASLGLTYGDLVTHWNGRPVEQPETLLWLIAAEPPGSSVTITWVRGVLTDSPQTFERTLTVTRRPISQRWPARLARLPELTHAIEVDWATSAPNFAAVADRLPETGAVWVSRVNRAALPPDANLEAGVWITQVNDRAVDSSERFWELVQQGSATTRLKLLVPGASEPRTLEFPRESLLSGHAPNAP